jgi:hypothetical protein
VVIADGIISISILTADPSSWDWKKEKNASSVARRPMGLGFIEQLTMDG